MGEEEKKEANGEEKQKPAKDSSGEGKKEVKPPVEEKKKEEEAKDGGETKEEQPPPEIILRVYMHCEGCARKVRRSLKGYDGVEDVTTDCKASKVVVKGEKADPLKVLDRLQKKSHRKVELLSPIPKPPSEEEKKDTPEEKPSPPEEKKEEPQVISVVLKVHMHCEACAMEIKKRILRMKGVESVEPDIKTSEVAVKGAFDATTLVDYVYKRTGKQAVLVRQEPKNSDDKEPKEEKEAKKGEENKDATGKKETEDAAKQPEKAAEQTETAVIDTKKNEYYFHPSLEMTFYSYPPQIFSDENPNACTVM